MSRTKQQTDFFQSMGLKASASLSFGGSKPTGKRKTTRPISTKDSMHLVLRAQSAQGSYNFLLPQNFLKIEKIVLKYSRKYSVKIESFANVGNHLHFMIRCRTRVGFQRFLRVVTGLIAREITGVQKGRKLKTLQTRFWMGLAYTRVVKGFKAYGYLLDYIKANRLEAFFGKDMREAYLLARKKYRQKLSTAMPSP